jgi:hypothetical protein
VDKSVDNRRRALADGHRPAEAGVETIFASGPGMTKVSFQPAPAGLSELARASAPASERRRYPRLGVGQWLEHRTAT